MATAIRVASFNLKRDSFFHGPHSWKNRRELVMRLIQESGAAIVGVQYCHIVYRFSYPAFAGTRPIRNSLYLC